MIFPLAIEFPVYWTIFYPFFRALVFLREAKTGKKRHLKLAKKEFAKSKTWSKAKLLNYPCIHLLFEAELLTVTKSSKAKDVDSIRSKFDLGINMASRSGFSPMAMIGNELAADFFWQRGDNEEALNYFGRLFQLLNEWGAHGKISYLVQKYSMKDDALFHKTLKGTYLSRIHIDESKIQKHKEKDWLRTSESTTTDTSSTRLKSVSLKVY